MTEPKKELPIYLEKLIGRFIFIKYIYDERENINRWLQRPEGSNAIEEGRSFFNLFQRISSQTLIIELCKFIDDDEKKSLVDFLNKCRKDAKQLESTLSKAQEGFPKKVILPDLYAGSIDKIFEKLNAHKKTIHSLKFQRDKALMHTDASFCNNPDRHFENYPLSSEDLSSLLSTIEKILEDQAIYFLQSVFDFTLDTGRGVDRVLEMMRACNKLESENGLNIMYRFDNYYEKKE